MATDGSVLSDITRDRIDAAVLKLFSERDFHHVKLIEVAREARVSLQTIYKYYGDKETLFFACLDRWVGRLTRRMLDHLQGIAGHQDRLRKVFWVTLDFFERHPEVAQLMMTSTYITSWRGRESFRQEELMAVFLRVLSEGRDQGVLTDEVEPPVLLDFIFGVIHRRTLMWILRGRGGGLTEGADVQFEMLWRAIARPTQPV